MDVDGEKGCIAACRKLKIKHPELKVIVSVGGGAASGHFAEMAHKKGTRAAFVSNVKEFVDGYGFDGLDGKSLSFPSSTAPSFSVLSCSA